VDADDQQGVKTYIGQKGRDRSVRLWVENYGRRSPLSGDDIAARILSDVFGARLVEDDYRCYQEFRDTVIAPRLDEATWSLTESDVRDWKEAYGQQATRPSTKQTDETASDASKSDEPQYALVSWGTGITRARLLHVTPGVLLLEGEQAPGKPLPPGAPLRVGLPGTNTMVPGRLAASGQQGRFLIALGSRAVRGSARVRVELRAIARTNASASGRPVKVVDLSSSGARVRGLDLPIGSDFDLSFVPPGRQDLVTLRCVAVRSVGEDALPELGVAFCGGALSFRVDLTQAR
jgi:hypothetical protein